MQNEPVPVQIEFTPEFQRNLHVLAKKYRHIRTDLEPILQQLQAGQRIGDQIQGIRHTVLKVRVRNSDLQKGKSGGYRLIYWVPEPTRVVLITIYSKTDFCYRDSTNYPSV